MKISVAIRDLLIEHMDGREVPLVAKPGGPAKVLRACLDRGLLRMIAPSSRRPNIERATVITEIGRGALAQALAEWADALIRAGLDLNVPSPDLPLRLALLRKWANGARFLASQESSHI